MLTQSILKTHLEIHKDKFSSTAGALLTILANLKIRGPNLLIEIIHKLELDLLIALSILVSKIYFPYAFQDKDTNAPASGIKDMPLTIKSAQLEAISCFVSATKTAEALLLLAGITVAEG